MKKSLGIGLGLVLLGIALLVPSGVGRGLSPTEKWVARYNGPGNGDDRATAIAVDGSGNVYVAGESQGTGTGLDIATVKYSPEGLQLWAGRYDGSAHGDDGAKAVAVDGAGNVLVFGKSRGSGAGYDWVLIKYNAKGHRSWAKRLSAPKNEYDTVGGMVLDGSGNIYVAVTMSGAHGPQMKIVKYNTKGSVLWSRAYPSGGYGSAIAVAVDGTGQLHVAGSQFLSTNAYCVLKYDTGGRLLWVKNYDGPGGGNDYPKAIVVDGAGGVYVTGDSKGSGTGVDWATLKLDATGKQLWCKRYSSPGNGEDRVNAIAVDGAGNSYVAGWRRTSDSDWDYATLKYGPTGKQLWAKRYNGTYGYDIPYAIALDGSGNASVTGEIRNSLANRDIVTVWYKPSGGVLRTRTYDGPGAMDDAPHAMAADKNGNIYVAGESTGTGTGFDFVTIKY